MKTLILFLSLLVSAVFGQDPETKVREVKLQFACTGILKNCASIMLPEVLKINLSKRHPSTEFTLKTNTKGQCFIYRVGQNLEEDPNPLSTIQLPDKVNKALVLLIPNKDKNTYNSIVLNAAQYKRGCMTLLNMTPVPIAIKTEFKNIVLQPNSLGSLAPKHGDKKQTSVKMGYEKQVEGGQGSWILFYSSEWRVNARWKELVVLYIHPQTKKIRTYSIIQY